MPKLSARYRTEKEIVMIRYRTEEEKVMGDKNKLPGSDRVEGSAKNIGGKLTGCPANLTGDSKLKAESNGDRAEGKTQNAAGGLKDAVEDLFKQD
jgi:uncharacterized protein YjbJ (UPF0337 family)